MWWLAVSSDLRWSCGETSHCPRLAVTMSKRQCELSKACAVCENGSFQVTKYACLAISMQKSRFEIRSDFLPIFKSGYFYLCFSVCYFAGC